jgi:hypothetical protein
VACYPWATKHPLAQPVSSRLRSNLKRPYWLLDILDCLRTEVGELQRQDFPHLIVSHTGDTEPSSLGKRLQSGGNIHPVAEQIAGVDHNVPDMHADSEVDVTALGKPGVYFGQGILSLHGTPDGVDRAAKLRQYAVARCIGDTPPMRRNEAVQDFPALRKSVESGDLINTHEAAVALNVRREDSGQPTLHFDWVCQG